MSILFRVGVNSVRQSLKSHSLKNVILNVKRPTATVSISNEGSSKMRKAIGIWMAGCSGMVAGAVVLGGVTRLTESGLSMVDWRLIKDMIPPKNESEWQEEFARYQQFPEWKYVNKEKEMSLGQFKFIFYMEWSHRMWGRATGLVFLFPAAFFWAKGCFNAGMKKRMLVYGSLLGFQGFLGWYMVKSGLQEQKKSTDVPRVSQYRLAAHLGSAFILYTGFMWSSLTYLLPDPPKIILSDLQKVALKKSSLRAHHLMMLIFTTAMAGAFVAGLDAGLIYNDFPKMGNTWIPSDLFWKDEPIWRNFFENPTMTQFQHRVLGISTVSAICLYAYSLRGFPLPPRARLALNSLVAMSFAQVSLGIATLLLYVPVSLAAVHQSGSLVLLSIAIWLANELKRIPK